MRYISVSEYLMDRITLDKLTDEQVRNMNTLIPKVNELLEKSGEYRKVNSGYRSLEDQQRINPKSMKSKHLECAAVDLEDKDGALGDFCLHNLDLLVQLGLYLESPESTPGWVHLQCVAPKSGKTIFRP